MNHILEPDVTWLRDPGASVNRLTVHATWRSRRPLQMLSSTWQVTGVTGTAAELIDEAPVHQNFGATSVPGILELDGSRRCPQTQARPEAQAHAQTQAHPEGKQPAGGCHPPTLCAPRFCAASFPLMHPSRRRLIAAG